MTSLTFANSMEEKMINSQNPIARKNGLVIQEVPDEVLVYDMEANKAHCLNKTAGLVWRSCDGVNSVSDIASIVEASSNTPVSQDLVWLAIDQLNENNLMETAISPTFSGQSRRDVIKKIGLGAMVALPIVASLAAPQSALANLSCACALVADCAAPGCPTATACIGSVCVLQ